MSNSHRYSVREVLQHLQRGASLLLCILTTLAAPVVLAETRLAVREASLSLYEGVYELDARLDLNLPVDARKAIDSGLTLRLDYEIRISRVRHYLPDDGVAELVQSYELVYHALSQRYLLRHLNSGVQQDFGSLDGALERLQLVRGLPVIDAALLENGSIYEISIRGVLDMGTAPAVFGWLRFWADDWNAASDWYSWTLPR